MASCQSTEACWSSLPEPVAAMILQLAINDNVITPSLWLRWALVCRHVLSTPQPALKLQ